MTPHVVSMLKALLCTFYQQNNASKLITIKSVNISVKCVNTLSLYCYNNQSVSHIIISSKFHAYKFLVAAVANTLCTGSAFPIKRFFTFVASTNRTVLFAFVFDLTVSGWWFLVALSKLLVAS